MTTKDKFIKAGIILFLIALAAFFAYFFYLQILVVRGDLIKFDGRWYEKDDWQELYGEYDTPAKNTPEEVYENFRQALLDGNKEKALSFIRPESREYYREAFKNEERLETYKKIPELSLIRKNENDSYGNYSVYSYFIDNNSDNIPYYINFEKNRAGYWEIDSI